MTCLRLTMFIFAMGLSVDLFAEEPKTKAEQCEEYGAYQDQDGNWQTCSEEDMPSDDDS